MTDVRYDVAPSRLFTALFTAIAALMAVDVVDDARTRLDVPHLVVEVAVIVLALLGALALWRDVIVARRHARRLSADLHLARADAERWRGEAEVALRGLSDAIALQLDRWGLTAAERDIGLLLLKGLSHKEIAQLRASSERTVRQQALAVYRKADVRGRAELAAFFLEGLPVPAPPVPPGDA